jgi:hypothetical protein
MLLSKRRLDRAVVIGFACFLSVVFGCPAPSTAPEQYALELADRGTLVVDVERVDSWKKSYRSTFTYLPPLGAGGPEPVAEVPGQYLPQSLIGVEQEQLDLMPVRFEAKRSWPTPGRCVRSGKDSSASRTVGSQSMTSASWSFRCVPPTAHRIACACCSVFGETLPATTTEHVLRKVSGTAANHGAYGVPRRFGASMP